MEALGAMFVARSSILGGMSPVLVRKHSNPQSYGKRGIHLEVRPRMHRRAEVVATAMQANLLGLVLYLTAFIHRPHQF